MKPSHIENNPLYATIDLKIVQKKIVIHLNVRIFVRNSLDQYLSWNVGVKKNYFLFPH